MTARKSPLSVAAARRTAAVALGGPARAAVGEDGAFSYGFDRADGTLSRGAGASCYIAAAALPAGEEAAGLFGLPAGGAEALYCRSGKLYARTAGAFSDTGVNFAAVPASVRFFDGAEEKLALSDGVSVAVLGAQGCAAAEGIPPFSAAAFWYERLWTFAGSGAEYSAPADPASFAAARGGGGSVSFPDAAGEIEAAVTFRGGLFLLRGRGVQELSARGDERAFCLGDVCACPRLYGATAAAAPEGVFWLSESGLCRFDGSKVQPFAEDFAGFFAGVEQPAARAAVWRGNYVLSARARLGGEVEDVLALFRCDGSGGYILRRAARGLASCGDAVTFVHGGAVYRLTEGGPFAGVYGRAVWAREVRSPYAGGLLRAVRVRAEGSFLLTVRGPHGLRRLPVFDGERDYPVKLAGDAFALRLESDGPGRVLSLRAEFSKAEVRA